MNWAISPSGCEELTVKPDCTARALKGGAKHRMQYTEKIRRMMRKNLPRSDHCYVKLQSEEEGHKIFGGMKPESVVAQESDASQVLLLLHNVRRRR